MFPALILISSDFKVLPCLRPEPGTHLVVDWLLERNFALETGCKLLDLMQARGKQIVGRAGSPYPGKFDRKLWLRDSCL